MRPGIWGKRGSQAAFRWELILPRRQREGRQSREQPPALFNNPLQGDRKHPVSGSELETTPKTPRSYSTDPLCLQGSKETKKIHWILGCWRMW